MRLKFSLITEAGEVDDKGQATPHVSRADADELHCDSKRYN